MFERRKDQDKTEVHAQKQVASRQELVKSLIVQPGQKLWEYNIATGEIKEATFEKQNIVFPSNAAAVMAADKFKVNKKLVMQEGYLYAPALNKKNAEKVFKRQPQFFKIEKT